MTTGILRVDGSATLGMGHIERCRGLAEAMTNRGIEPLFVCRRLDGFPRASLARDGYEAQMIDPAGLEEDAQATASIADRRDSVFIITDIVHGDYGDDIEELRRYHRALPEDLVTIAFSNGHVRDLGSDLVVDPYVHSVRSDGTEGTLGGPKYFVFRRELRDVIPAQRSHPDRADRLLVTIGGSDKCHITEQVLEALIVLNDADLEASVIVGPAYPSELVDRARALAERVAGEVVFLEDDGDLPRQMARADMAVTGDGLTKYETALFGLPSLIIPRPNSDPTINDPFGKQGTARILPSIDRLSVQRLAEEIANLRDDPAHRRSMSETGRSLLDGRGVDRILDQILARCSLEL